MKTRYILIAMTVLCACNKVLEIKSIINKPELSGFSSMLSREKTYIVSAYYKNDQQLDIPAVNSEDTYTFDGKLNDGRVNSKQPCIEYHYNFKAFESNDSILFEWVNFQIVPQTFTVTDYKIDEWFILKSGDTYTRYEVKNNQLH